MKYYIKIIKYTFFGLLCLCYFDVREKKKINIFFPSEKDTKPSKVRLRHFKDGFEDFWPVAELNICAEPKLLLLYNAMYEVGLRKLNTFEPRIALFDFRLEFEEYKPDTDIGNYDT